VKLQIFGDLVRTIIVDSTVVTRMRRNEVISNHNIKAGDVIIGLSSSGKTTMNRITTEVWAATGLLLPGMMFLQIIWQKNTPRVLIIYFLKAGLCGNLKVTDKIGS